MFTKETYRSIGIIFLLLLLVLQNLLTLNKILTISVFVPLVLVLLATFSNHKVIQNNLRKNIIWVFVVLLIGLNLHIYNKVIPDQSQFTEDCIAEGYKQCVEALENAGIPIYLDKELTDEEKSRIVFERTGLTESQIKQYSQDILKISRDLYELALASYNLGDYDHALQYIDVSLQKNTKDSSAFLLKGALLAHIGDIDGAYKATDKSLSLNSNNPVAWYNLGVILQSLGHFNDAIDAYDNAIHIRPNFVDAMNNKARVYSEQNMTSEALELYNEILSIDSEYARAWNNRGVLLKELGHKESALKSYQQAVNLSPHSTVYWNNLGILQQDIGNFQESENSYRKSLENNPLNSGVWYNLGLLLGMNLLRHNESLAAFNTAIEINDSDPDIWHNRAVVQEQLNQLNESLYSINRALELDSERELSIRYKAHILSKLGRFDEIIDLWIYGPESNYTGNFYNNTITGI